MTTHDTLHDSTPQILTEGFVASFVAGNEMEPAQRPQGAASQPLDFESVQRGRLVFSRSQPTHQTAVLCEWGPSMVTIDLALDAGGLSLNGLPRPARTLLVFAAEAGSVWGGRYSSVPPTSANDPAPPAPEPRRPHLSVSIPLEMWNEMGLDYKARGNDFLLCSLTHEQASSLYAWLENAINNESFRMDSSAALREQLQPLLGPDLRECAQPHRVSKYMSIATRGAELSKRLGSVREILAELNISERTLQRAFQQTFGTCPRYYMSSQRHGDAWEYRAFGAQSSAAAE